jgi:hypothetical protein
MPFYQKRRVQIHSEKVGRGLPPLLIHGAGRMIRLAMQVDITSMSSP